MTKSFCIIKMAVSSQMTAFSVKTIERFKDGVCNLLIVAALFSLFPAILFAQQGSMDWTQATANAGWSARSSHTSVVFDNKMWVMGGYGPSNSNDVWYSSNGINWDSTNRVGTRWSARSSHTSVVFDNKIWVMGGYDASYNRRNDVWHSTDGVNWTQATANAGWSGRYGHTSVVFDNKIWVIGGNDATGNLRNDVWYSTNGINWTQATANAGWSGRYGHTSVVFDNKMWILGGHDGSYNRRDVWYSSDGVTWTQATANASWSAREGHTSVVFDNKMWVIGGYTSSSPYYRNDVWYSSNGVNWTQATGSAGWSGRDGHTSVVFDNKIWVLGGEYASYNYRNDVWCSRGGITLLIPNGGEVWPGWSNQIIKWRTIGTGFARYRLLLSRNSGSTYTDTISHNVAPTETTYNWLAPTLNLNTCRVMVQILDAGGSVISSDASDGNFTIQTVSIISPNGGEIWAGGSNQIIKWWTIGTGFARYRLLLSRNGGSTYTDTIAHNIAPTETTYNWTVPYLNLTTCRLMVQILNAVGSVISQDASDGNFTIQTTVTVVLPNGGEFFGGGSNQIIKWRTVGTGFARYRLLLSRNGGSTYTDTIAQVVAPSETTYNWLVPTLNLTTCRILVQMLDAGGAVISQDASDGDFTIRTTVTVVSPNGGEVWIGASNQIIKWRTVGSGFTRYRLVLSTNGGATYPDTIAHNVAPSETTYNWTVPLINSTTCRLRAQILDAGGSVISQDASDGNFTISTTGIEENEGNNLPFITALYSPKPNPMTKTSVQISFSLAEPTSESDFNLIKGRPYRSKVLLKIYDVTGRPIKTLVDEFKSSGVYSVKWNGKDDNNRVVAEGVYFYTLETPKQKFTKKMIMVK